MISRLWKALVFYLKLEGIVFFAGYPYPEREKDGYYQRIRTVDSLFPESWKIYIDFPGRDEWLDRPTPHTLVIRPRGKGMPGVLILTVILLLILRCRVLYFHSIHAMRNWHLLWHFPGLLKILDLHGAVPEEYRYKGDEINARRFESIEASAVRHFQTIIVVSGAMQEHIERKYGRSIKAKFITLPIFQQVPPCQEDKPYGNGKPTVIYAGGMQQWQQVPRMIDAICRTALLYNYKFYCPEPGRILSMLPDDLRSDENLEVGYKSLDELFTAYRECHYGFILREDSLINQVACPTKLIEYLAMSIVPVVESVNIGDFKRMGMRSVPLQDLLENRLPTEDERRKMVRQNLSVYEKILEIERAGMDALRRIVTLA